MDDKQIAQEVLEKHKTFEENHLTHFQNFNSWYKLYRGRPEPRTIGKSNTFIPELFTETEALVTAVFEMIFSDNSDATFFDTVAQSPEDAVGAYLVKATLSQQFEKMELQRKMMPFLRGLIRDGYAAVEVPWRLEYARSMRGGNPVSFPRMDCHDFQYINPLNFACAEGKDCLEDMEWASRAYYVTEAQLRSMGNSGTWKNTELATGSAGLSEFDKARRDIAGYQSNSKSKLIRCIEYFGEMNNIADGYRYRTIVSENGVVLYAPEVNPYEDGGYPYLDCKWVECDNELYGIGIAEFIEKQQKEINDRRNFINDNLFASLYNMWALGTDSGLKTKNGTIPWEPYKVLEMDNPQSLAPLRPPLEGITYARQLESSDMDTMRRTSGATSTLQAVANNTTATESQMIQNEATRRIRALVRAQIGTFLKKYLYMCHGRNLQFLDRSVLVRAYGPDGQVVYTMANNGKLSKNPDFRVKLTTDLDFRPFRRKELLEFLQNFAQLAKTQGFNLDPFPIIKQISAHYGINPAEFKREVDVNLAMTNPEIQKRAISDIIGGSQSASQMMAQIKVGG